MRRRAHERVQNAFKKCAFLRRALDPAIIALQHAVEAERLSKALRRVVASHHHVHTVRNHLTNTVYRILYIRTESPHYDAAANRRAAKNRVSTQQCSRIRRSNNTQ